MRPTNHTQYTPFSLLSSIIHIHKQNVFRKLKYFLLFIMIYAAIIGLLSHKFDIIRGNAELGQFHLLFSFCLSIIIAFRINVSYARWWEARGHLGTLVNTCRSLAIKLNCYIGLDNNRSLLDYIAQFPILLKFHLHHDRENCYSILAELNIPYTKHQHAPNLLIQAITNEINSYHLNQQISFAQFLTLDAHITALVDLLGSCEKILNTTPPSSFSTFTRFALLFYMLIFPFGWFNSFDWFVLPILAVIIYVLLGLEVIAEEMEQPFGADYDDLPLDAITQNITDNVFQIAKMASTPHHCS